VGGDGVSPGVEAPFVELLAELNDLVLDADPDLVGAVVRPPGPGLEPGVAPSLVSGDQLMNPPARHPVVPSHPALRQALHLDRRYHQPTQRHTPPPCCRCALCRATRVNYVLKPDTAEGAM